MARILVVCGAGASSTFLAHRMRALAAERGVPVSVEAAAESDLAVLSAGVDVVLVGHHLHARFDQLSRAIASEGAVAVLLPPAVFTPAGAAAALDAALSEMEGRVG
jgi:PTS system cellobiose-specific IIB component